MEVIRQALHDTKKSLRSIIAFGIVTIVSWVFMIWAAGDFRLVVSENRYIEAFKKDNVQYVLVDTFDSLYSPDPYSDPNTGRFDSSSYLVDKLGKDGNAGVILNLRETEFTNYNTVFILGIYNDYLVEVEIPETGIVFIGSKDLYERRDGKVRINGKAHDLLHVSKVPDIFYPQGFFENGSTLDNTLFVCSRDFRAVKEVFPWLTSYDMDGLMLMDRMIFRDLSTEDNVQLRRQVMRSTGRYAQIISCQEYYSRNKISNIRQTLVYLVFYSLAFIVMPVSMAINNYANLLNNEQNYLVHRTFGSTVCDIVARMLILSMSYYVLPLAFSFVFFRGTQYMKEVRWSMPIAVAGAFTSVVLAFIDLRQELVHGKGGAE